MASGETVPSEVLKTVIDSYYTRGVAAVDRARDGAEKGYTIASAIAAALVAAGVFAHLDAKPELVQVLGLLALVSWLVAAIAFMRAIALPAATGRDPNWPTEAAFVEGVAASTESELTVLRHRLAIAFWVTFVAIIVTVAALASATFESSGAAPEKARIAVTAKEDAALKSLCSMPVADVYGVVHPDDLAKDVVTVAAPAGACNARPTTLRIPNTAILAEERVLSFPGFPRG